MIKNTPKSIGMGGLLNDEDYEKFEEQHPGFKENISIIIKHLESLKARTKIEGKFTIIEMGAGPGNPLTRLLGKKFASQGDKVIINELDSGYVEHLKKLRVQGRIDKSIYIAEAKRITELLKEQADGSVNAIVSNFAMHHLPPKELKEFFKEAKRVLRPGGLIIAGEEFLSPSNTGNERAAAHIEYHGRIIYDAISKGTFEDAKFSHLEFAAMVSGLKTVNDMKPNSSKELANISAIRLLTELTTKVEKLPNRDFVKGYNNAKEMLARSLYSLSGKLADSKIPGLAEDVVLFDPDKCENYSHPKMDYKITFKELSEKASQQGFNAFALPTGATQLSDREWYDPKIKSKKSISPNDKESENPGVYVAVLGISGTASKVRHC